MTMKIISTDMSNNKVTVSCCDNTWDEHLFKVNTYIKCTSCKNVWTPEWLLLVYVATQIEENP